MDPLEGSTWSAPGTVAGFTRSQPNAVLVQFAAERLRGAAAALALDLGCGAGRNAVPLAELGFAVLGTDLSWPMLQAAMERAKGQSVAPRLLVALAPMDRIPVADRSIDLVIAHGIWNLARSGAEFRRALGEAARVAKPGAGLFVFTFSRRTLPDDAEPVPGEEFVFTQFSGQPQCFLTEVQLESELSTAGFARDPRVPWTEYNRPGAGMRQHGGPPVIHEAAFCRAG